MMLHPKTMVADSTDFRIAGVNITPLEATVRSWPQHWERCPPGPIKNDDATLLRSLTFELAQSLREIPGDLETRLREWLEDSGGPIALVGYTDDSGAVSSNFELEAHRARFVAGYFENSLHWPASSIEVIPVGPASDARAQATSRPVDTGARAPEIQASWAFTAEPVPRGAWLPGLIRRHGWPAAQRRPIHAASCARRPRHAVAEVLRPPPGMGASQLTNGASSWILHMAFIILVSNVCGLVLQNGAASAGGRSQRCCPTSSSSWRR